MDLYYGDKLITTMNIEPDFTVGYLKKKINDWLVPQNITKYALELYLNDGSKVDQTVFNANNYDQIKFGTMMNKIPKSKLVIIPSLITASAGDTVYVFALVSYEDKDYEIIGIYFDKESAYKEIKGYLDYNGHEEPEKDTQELLREGSLGDDFVYYLTKAVLNNLQYQTI